MEKDVIIVDDDAIDLGQITSTYINNTHRVKVKISSRTYHTIYPDCTKQSQETVLENELARWTHQDQDQDASRTSHGARTRNQQQMVSW